MKKKRLFITFMSALLLLTNSLSVSASEAMSSEVNETTNDDSEEIIDNNTAASIVYSGKDGALSWTIDSNGLLTVSGNGDYDSWCPEWTNYADSIKTADINVKDISSTYFMFRYCDKLTSIDFTDFDTSNVTNMNGMFYYCNNLASLDLSTFDTTNVTDMSNMFYRCNSLTLLRCP